MGLPDRCLHATPLGNHLFITPLPADTPDGKLQDLLETAKAHICDKGEHPFRVIKQQFGFQKTRLRCMVKNRCKVNVLAALTNLFLARRQLLATP